MITRVRSTGKASGANVTNITKSFSSLPTAGNLILVEAWVAFNITMASGDVTDNQGNTYVLATSKGGVATSAIYYCVTGATSGTFTITFNPVNTGQNWLVFAATEWSSSNGWDVSFCLDRIATSNGSSSTPSVGATAMTTQADEIVAAVLAFNGFGINITVETVSPAWTEEVFDNGGVQAGEGDTKIVSAAATQTCSWTVTANNQWTAVIATFRDGLNPSANISRVTQVGRQTLFAETNPEARLTQMARVVFYRFTCTPIASPETCPDAAEMSMSSGAAADCGDQILDLPESTAWDG